MKLLNNISANLLEVLQLLPNNYYTQPIPIFEQQTIGQQVRHIIEHWQILIENYNSGYINYANRKRDITIEQNKQLAINLLQILLEQSDKKNSALNIVSMDESTAFTSSYFRELDNVAEHIIHHAAIIKMAILSIDIDFKIPANFGYAPSTILHKEQTCAQ
jgi:hypothetical protein